MTRSSQALTAAALIVLGTPPAAAEMRVDANAELRLLELGQTPPRRIPGAVYRVAVCTFEDPDGTGLGNDLAALAARGVLTGGDVSSLGVLRYEGNLSPRQPGDLSYFDKVDRIVTGQDASLAVWGRIGRARGRLSIDTFVQVPPKALEGRFTWRLRLPQAMGGEVLLARLRPNRLAVQRLELPPGAEGEIRSAARRLDELRREASAGSPVVARLPMDQVYFLARRQGDWVFLQVRGGPGGWAGLPGCPGGCGAFLRAARFAGELLAYMERGAIPEEVSGLTPEAEAVRDQLRAFDGLNDADGIDQTISLARRWIGAPGPQPEGGAVAAVAAEPPGGAAFANTLALGRLSNLLKDGFSRAYEAVRPQLEDLREQVRAGRLERPAGVPAGPEALARGRAGLSRLDVALVYDRVELDREAVQDIAFDLVKAALNDPRNPEVLHNVETLFRAAGDEERAARAGQLAEQVAR